MTPQGQINLKVRPRSCQCQVKVRDQRVLGVTTDCVDGGGGGTGPPALGPLMGAPMSHVNFKKWQCRISL